MFWALSAEAATPEAVVARVEAIESTRSQRLVKDAPRITRDQIRSAAEGTIVAGILEVAGSQNAKGFGAAVLSLSIGTLWSAINDETRHPGYTAVSYSELLVGRPCQSGRRVFQFLPVPMLDDRWWIGVLTANSTIARNSGGAIRELTWTSSVDPNEVKSPSGKLMMSQGVPIGSTRGAWLLVAIDERTTYLEYYSWTDPGEGVSHYVASSLASRGIRSQILAIESFAKGGRPSCPLE